MKKFISCSSSNDIDKKYFEDNKQLLDLISQENDLVFGASNDYKSIYEYGLTLLKDSLDEVNISPYSAMLPYFTYPLSLIEDTVEKARNSKTDTNEFYKEECDELLKLYDRLFKTSLLCQRIVGTRKEKKRANKILKLFKSSK